MASQIERPDIGSPALWFARGMANIISLPALFLMGAFVGFAGFAKESGIEMQHAVFMTFFVWALPAKVVLVAAVNAGQALVPTFLAVTLSSARLMPMVTTFVPEVRGPKSRTATLLILSHFVAVTAWVVAMERMRRAPPERRTVYFAGFAVTLTTLNATIVALVYITSAALPALVLGALFFLTPIYFLTSLWATARDHIVKIAMLTGMALSPVFHLVAPEFDLLLAGLIGGVAAFAIGSFWKPSGTPSQ
ncbi:AzlC family ABC transporter permease [Oricola sp.]|uniref:AzlC family ABC transporter permease n=1 Tax=Oricola sp. TaxID=1979950 RepID=UPI003BA8721F